MMRGGACCASSGGGSNSSKATAPRIVAPAESPATYAFPGSQGGRWFQHPTTTCRVRFATELGGFLPAAELASRPWSKAPARPSAAAVSTWWQAASKIATRAWGDTRGEVVQHDGDWNAGAAEARSAVHDLGIDGDHVLPAHGRSGQRGWGNIGAAVALRLTVSLQLRAIRPTVPNL